MFRRGIGISNVSMIPLREMVSGAMGSFFGFDLSQVTFTPYMDKRLSSGPFETAPIVQNSWSSLGVGDTIYYSSGSKILDKFYTTIDDYQGSITFWITPEWDGNDNKYHFIWGSSATNAVLIQKLNNNTLNISLYAVGHEVSVSTAAWTAGTTYFIVARWNKYKPIDGTNYMSLSVNDAHTFGRTSPITTIVPSTTQKIGYLAANYVADAIIEGLTVYRRVLYDGTYGQDIGNGDEINLIWAAGAGKDPCLVTGSWDVVFCLPTNSTAGALVTGTGEAWSHPHSSNEVEHGWLEDGGYLGDQWALNWNTSDDGVNCGSGATLDDIPDGANGFTAEAWVRPELDSWHSYNRLFNKAVDSGVDGWAFGVDGTLDRLTAKINYASGFCC